MPLLKQHTLLAGFIFLMPILTYAKPQNCLKMAGYHSLYCDEIDTLTLIPVISQRTKKHGYANAQGQIVIQPQFDKAYPFAREYAIAYKNNKIGLIDRTGKTIIPFIYEEFEYTLFDHSFITLKKNGKWGIVNEKNKTIIPFEYDSFSGSFDNKWISVKKHGKWGVIDLNHQTLIPFIYDYVYFLDSQFIILVQNNKYGIIDLQQNSILPIQFDDFNSFYKNGKLVAFKAKQNEKWGLFDLKGNALTSLDYIALDEYSDDLIRTYKNDYFGIIDSDANTVIPSIYRHIEPFDQTGLIKAKNHDNKFGYINKNNQIIIPFEYDELSDFRYDHSAEFKQAIAIAKKQDKVGLIDKNNQIIIPLI